MIFDAYPADARIRNSQTFLVISYGPRALATSRFVNMVVHSPEDDRLDLTRAAETVTVPDLQASVECHLDYPPVVDLTNPIPLPMTALNYPQPALEPDGSYDYTPNISGGYGPYTFELIGNVEDLGFNTATGELSRQPG